MPGKQPRQASDSTQQAGQTTPETSADQGGSNQAALEGMEQGSGQTTTLPGDTTVTTGGGSDTAKQTEAVADMGEVSTFDSGFFGKAGALLDASCPNAGDKNKLQVAVNVPVDSSGTIKVGFDFSVETEREDNGNLKARCQLLASVLASKKANLYFATIEAFAQFKGGGYIEASGQKGGDIFGLFGLAIQQRVNNSSSTVADAIFGERYAADMLESMGKDDYVESGLMGEFSAGLSVKTDDDERGNGVAVGASSGTRLSKGDSGELKKDAMSQASVALSLGISPFQATGKILAKDVNGKADSVEASLEGEAMVSASDLSELAEGGQWLSGMISQAGSLISEKSGAVSNSGARQVGALGSFMVNGSAAGALASTAAAKAIDKLDRYGVKLGHKLSIKGTWTEGKGFELDVDLERVRQIEFGDGPRDTVYVLLENVDRVFKIHKGPQASA